MNKLLKNVTDIIDCVLSACYIAECLYYIEK